MTGTEIEPEAAARSEPPPVDLDRSLALAASRGDDSAFARIYERHRPAIYRYCASMLGEHDAADALQATMTKALIALRGGDAPRDLRPWLYRIAHNESIDMIRERRSRTALGEAVEQHSGTSGSVAPSPAEQSEDRQRLERLITDIRSLPERQRSAILMRELSGLSTKDIAAALETSESTAKQAVYEARVALIEIREGREMPCEPVQRALSDGDGRVLRGRQVRAHLRGCERCQAFAAAIDDRSRTLNSFAPVLPAVVAGGILQQVLGAGAGAGAAGGGAGVAAAGAGAAATGAGAAGGAAALSGGVAKLAAIAAATLAIGAGGYGGLKATGVVGGGAGERSAESGPGSPADPGDSSPVDGDLEAADAAGGASATGSSSSSAASTARQNAGDSGGARDIGDGAATEDGSGSGSGPVAGAPTDAGERGVEQAEGLPEAADDGQGQAESVRPDHAGRPDAPGPRAGENTRGSERSAGGRERAEQGGNGSSRSSRGGGSGAERGQGSSAGQGRDPGRGAGTGSAGRPEQSNGGSGEREPRSERESKSQRGGTTRDTVDEGRQERGERPS